MAVLGAVGSGATALPVIAGLGVLILGMRVRTIKVLASSFMDKPIHSDCRCTKKDATYHRLITKLLHKRVEDHSERLRRHSCARNLLRVTVHARLPDATCPLHSRDNLLRSTAIPIVFNGASGDFDHDFGRVFRGFDVDVGHDASPGGVDDVDEEAAEEHVDGELEVVR